MTPEQNKHQVTYAVPEIVIVKGVSDLLISTHHNKQQPAQANHNDTRTK